ncbi:myo-inositol-1(or 4)-monophosphatase [Thermocatellispora tengchongensis]|uniref:Myo-inositol-1(Or 4)-monophosphatase n=1 Tax=Thermocatellispora tengchongensis TaxID=1073253 RepID=A0A840P8G0_9ACTN|nr:inositol monophosphatase family protein [Thermocatellispora tengchongensis]MBB5133497.1 myo-inositol-1(or 4)-monophosphatase [Thermocatellispora tengchongensis]
MSGHAPGHPTGDVFGDRPGRRSGHSALLPVATRAVEIAREIVLSRAPRSVRAKGDRDMVTDIDLAVEDAVRAFLAAETPELAMLGEEHGRTGAAGDSAWWVLDPVDGTANLARGIPLCGVSLALVEDGRPVVGAIDLPFLGARYTAAAGRGAYAGEERIGTSATTGLPEAMISIGDFAVGPDAEPDNRVRLALLGLLGRRAQRIRMLGSAAIDLAWVAQGRLDATVILSNLPWDTMAGALLVREAGGLVLDRDGTEHTTASAATIALCPGLRDELMTALHQAGA